jgi:hypothetical protein
MKEVNSSNPQPWRRTSKAMKASTYNHAKRQALARTKRRKHDSGHKNWVYNVWTGPMPLLSELMNGGGVVARPLTSQGRGPVAPLRCGRMLWCCGGVGQGGHNANSRDCHQPPGNLIVPDSGKHLPMIDLGTERTLS